MTRSGLQLLVQELLDAQLDTIELAAMDSDDQRWRAHIDYLRALRRRATELLASA